MLRFDNSLAVMNQGLPRDVSFLRLAWLYRTPTNTVKRRVIVMSHMDGFALPDRNRNRRCKCRFVMRQICNRYPYVRS
jgi:hypothetical protein